MTKLRKIVNRFLMTTTVIAVCALLLGGKATVESAAAQLAGNEPKSQVELTQTQKYYTLKFSGREFKLDREKLSSAAQRLERAIKFLPPFLEFSTNA